MLKTLAATEIMGFVVDDDELSPAILSPRRFRSARHVEPSSCDVENTKRELMGSPPPVLLRGGLLLDGILYPNEFALT